MNGTRREHWGTRFGVVLAVTGSAVGLGNFLRFPGQAARYGGGAFLIPPLTAFLLVGLPLAWVEWTLGRQGGPRGYNSTPGIFQSLLGTRKGAYAGLIGTLTPLMINMHYLYIEAWCLAYAWDYVTGRFVQVPAEPGIIEERFLTLVGAGANGQLFSEPGAAGILPFTVICLAVNLTLVSRGIRRGIECFCRWAMPLLVICGLLVLARVLTLPGHPDIPDRTVLDGLGYMWNPARPGLPLVESLAKPETWLAATGQVFLSLSVGFGLILTYASYLKPEDDVALSCLTACAGDGFCEVVLGGMIAIPAAFVFLGPAVIGNPPGTFGMGFVVLPNVFSQMPLGGCFGFIFFFLLFLAAITSSLSMMQPVIALLEEGLKLRRKTSVSILGALTLGGCLFVVFFSKDFAALDTIDFWMANFLIFILATIQVIVFAWVLGVGQEMEGLRRGAAIRLPRLLPFVLKYVSPVYLLTVFGLWSWKNLPERWQAITAVPREGPPVALLSVLLIVTVSGLLVAVVHRANRVWDREEGNAL
jgi:SNF family Na+-dependent transporter